MDLAVTTDIYCPNVKDGQYVDFVPFIDKSCGIKCPCNGRSRSYYTKQAFRTHHKTKRHIDWLASENANMENHYKELINCHEIINNQKKIIAQLSQQISELSLCLATNINPRPVPTGDLIQLD